MNVIIEIFSNGGLLMWPLLLCSLCSLTMSIERLIFWLLEYKKRNTTLLGTLFKLTEEGRIDEALRLFHDKTDMTARVLFYGLTHHRDGLRENMELRAAEFITQMKRGLRALETIIAVAPLLGILGTVMGIIDSFNILGLTGIADPRGVVSGIAVALITTAFGLSIAIITIIPYNFFLPLVQKKSGSNPAKRNPV
jgi:biopolymer transport protein ExbB